MDEQAPLLGAKTVTTGRQENIKGWALVKTADFWLLFSIEGLLAGVGLMCEFLLLSLTVETGGADYERDRLE